MPITKNERQAIDKLIHFGKLMSHKLYQVATKEKPTDGDKEMLGFIEQWEDAVSNLRAIAKAEPEPKKGAGERVSGVRPAGPE